jgi:hypothetical protein
MSVLTKDQLTLLVVISSGCLVLLMLWVAALQFTNGADENFRSEIDRELAEARTTYQSLKAQMSSTAKARESYEATRERGNDEERHKAYTAWTHSSEKECELEVLVRKRVAAIEAKVKDRAGKIVLPEWLRENQRWQSLQRHMANSEFYEPIGGCRAHYDKLR